MFEEDRSSVHYDPANSSCGKPSTETPLRQEHRADLQQSGLTAETIRKSGIFSVTGEEAIQFLGFDPGAGMAIPYPGTDLVRLKPDTPMVDQDGKKAKYLSPRKERYPAGNRLYIPANIHPLVLSDAGVPLIITEGEKKALAACQYGFPCIALAGVTCWVRRDGETSTAISDLDLINWEARRVFIIFDSDIADKQEVREACKGLFGELIRRHAAPIVPKLPVPTLQESESYNLKQKFGLDDLLRVRGASALKDILDSARRKMPDRLDSKKAIPIDVIADWVLKHRDFRFAADTLWVFEGGAYHPYGSDVVKKLTLELLTEDHSWNTNRENNVVDYIATKTMIPRQTGLPEPSIKHINVTNGRVNIATGDLEPHSATFFETTQLPVRFDPKATCPRIDKFLEEVLVEQDKIDLVDEMVGYCLIGIAKFERAFMLTGCGANGKSTFLNLLEAFLGEQNVSQVALQDLADNRFKLAALVGKLANVCADLDSRSLSTTGLFKQIVSGDGMNAERKYGHAFDFRPTAKLIFSCNALPFSADHSRAYFRRWSIIPFTRVFPPGQADVTLIDSLIRPEELSGFLNRAMTGLRRLLMNQRFTEPASVKEMVAEYELDLNHVLCFVQECCDRRPDLEVLKKDLFGAYRTWCENEGIEHPINNKRFGKELRQFVPGLGERRPGDGPDRERRWKGLALRDEVDTWKGLRF